MKMALHDKTQNIMRGALKLWRWLGCDCLAAREELKFHRPQNGCCHNNCAGATAGRGGMLATQFKYTAVDSKLAWQSK